MCIRCPRVNIALGNAGLLVTITQRLGYPDAAVRLTLLRLLRSIYEQALNPKHMVSYYGLEGHLKKLAEGG
eukprot:CAMPEP_0119147510 /NCGR_PEP_ID=MMETSP1310-20130426/40489_1 /TAXON_ID=464262 /ORGANISM="Genus nov. species nov., Strain RCC2339" /LENGTH=70 /DNA_ID=CAMNT_0007139483 /DNA_START=17 /DNA_END=225 /DNA_ORIENTATION=-